MRSQSPSSLRGWLQKCRWNVLNVSSARRQGSVLPNWNVFLPLLENTTRMKLLLWSFCPTDFSHMPARVNLWKPGINESNSVDIGSEEKSKIQEWMVEIREERQIKRGVEFEKKSEKSETGFWETRKWWYWLPFVVVVKSTNYYVRAMKLKETRFKLVGL